MTFLKNFFNKFRINKIFQENDSILKRVCLNVFQNDFFKAADSHELIEPVQENFNIAGDETATN